jgi:tRNA1Val (adenine37-N6)-methyltransferase
MSGQSFVFKQFIVKQNKCAMKVGTDAVLVGAWAEMPKDGSVLDIGTGTGIIAMMAAQRSQAFVDALEIDIDSYIQAVENTSNCKWRDRIVIHLMSLQQYTIRSERKYDAIISNPPYFSNSLQASSESRTKARHTCTLKFEELLSGVATLLKPGGTFSTILPPKEAEDLINISKEHKLYLTRVTRVQTCISKPPKRLLMQFGFEPDSFSENTLIIESEPHSYTPSYKELTRDFYLGF